MDEAEKSPIIERLCKFISASGLSNSQFADKSGIPRPSLSQMLHGRNKSLNSQVLSKLNDAFPELNIAWLLFGHGNMLNVSNIEFSEAQNPAQTSFEPRYDTVTKPNTTSEDDYLETTNYRSNSENQPFSPAAQAEKAFAGTSNQSTPSPAAALAAAVSSNLNNRDNSKKIASIIVLFSDNSFETFLPASD